MNLKLIAALTLLAASTSSFALMGSEQEKKADRHAERISSISGYVLDAREREGIEQSDAILLRKAREIAAQDGVAQSDAILRKKAAALYPNQGRGDGSIQLKAEQERLAAGK